MPKKNVPRLGHQSDFRSLSFLGLLRRLDDFPRRPLAAPIEVAEQDGIAFAFVGQDLVTRFRADPALVDGE